MLIQVDYRYSNTLLVTFNNRIALRKTAFNEDSNGSGKSRRVPNDLSGSEVSTFRVGTDRFGGKSVGTESYEIQVRFFNQCSRAARTIMKFRLYSTDHLQRY